MNRNRITRALIFLFWLGLIAVSINFYLDNAVAYFFGYRNDRFGESLFNNQLLFVLHMVGGTCALFIGPIQFWTWFRDRYRRIHRFLGKVYVTGSIIAGITAVRLSIINPCQACRYSLLLLSVLLIFFTAAAYYSIRANEIDAHKQFMVRSYVCALAFVFVRLPTDTLFGMVESGMERGIVREWFFSLVPLLAVEFWMTWRPALVKAYRARQIEL